MTDSYAWYRAALTGAAPPISDGKPEAGYYRRRAHKGGPWVAAAIWIDNGNIYCRVGGDMKDPHQEWTWLAKNPVPQDQARAYFETGQWPAEVLLEPTVGHNQPPESLPELVQSGIEKATDWLRTHPEIKTKLDCDIAANLAAELIKLAGKADDERTAEKQPHLDAGREIDARWKAVIDPAKEAAKNLKTLAGRWMAAEEARLLKLERERQAAEKAKLDAERAKAAALNQPPPPEPTPVPVKQVKINAGGARGAKMGLKTVKIAVITDYEKAREFFKDHADMRALVQDLANRAMKIGTPVPGVEVKEERRPA